MSKARSVTDLQSKRPVEDVGFSEVDYSDIPKESLSKKIDWTMVDYGSVVPDSGKTVAEGVARRIKYEMSLRGMSQADLIRATGMNKNTISNLLLAKTDGISWDIMQQLSVALRLPVENLLIDHVDENAFTGIDSIDRIVHIVTNNLFMGEIGYEKVKKYFADDYNLVYADIQPGKDQKNYFDHVGNSSTRHGPDAETEFKLNSNNRVIRMNVSKVVVYRTHDPRVTNVPVIGVFNEVTARLPVNDTSGSTPHSRLYDIRVAHGFDMWAIDTPIREVIENPTMDWKIKCRYVSSYHIEQK